LLRINPPSDTEGAPNALWYFGLNHVVQSSFARTGTGAQTANICLR